jgi:hypothetical protein
MKKLLLIEKLLVSELTNGLGLSVYTNLPDGLKPPYVHITDIGTSEWLITPKGSRVEMSIKIFSERNSNQEVVEKLNKLRDILRVINMDGLHSVTFDTDYCYIDKSDCWVGEIGVQLLVIDEV